MGYGRVIQLEKGNVHNIIPAGTDATTTSRALRSEGHNALLLYVNMEGTGEFDVHVKGSCAFDGTYTDVYDHLGDRLETGQISTGRVQLFLGIPENIKIVATEMVDGATIQVNYQFITV